MKKILLAITLLIVAMSLMATARTIGTVTSKWQENLVMYSQTTSVADSSEDITYIDTANLDGKSLSGKKFGVVATITTTVVITDYNAVATKISPQLWASVDGTTFTLVKTIPSVYSGALTAGTVIHFVVDTSGCYAPFYQIRYWGMTAAGVYSTAANTSTHVGQKVSAGRITSAISAITTQKQ